MVSDTTGQVRTVLTKSDHQLRKLQMDVDKRDLGVQKAKQEVDRFIPELERKHNLMDSELVIDPRTGRITGSAPACNGKGCTEAATTVETVEAATYT
jgi:hypothetical protein